MRWTARWLMLGVALLFAGCPTADPGDDDADAADDDDVGDDDAGDDDAGDDDTGPFACEDLTNEELELLTKIFCAGSSNSFSGDVMDSPPDTAADLSWWYHGKIVEQVMINLGTCVAYEPELWVYWYSDVDEAPQDATLSWAMDATFHFLDDDPSEAVFRQRVEAYLAALYGPGGLSQDVTFIGANVPELMMGVTGFSGDTAMILQIIDEEMAKYPNTTVIDLDYFMDQLIMGNVTYDGVELEAEAILTDAVHINEFGHQIIADVFIQEINALWPALKVPQHAEIVIDN